MIGLHRIDRRETQPHELRDMFENLLHQCAELGRTRKIRAIAREIDASENDFAIAARAEAAHLSDHLSHRHRARIAAAIGNDAEGAAVVAAVLHLHEGARPAPQAIDQMHGRLPYGHDVVDRDFLLGGETEGPSRQIAATLAPDLRADLLLVAQDQRDLRHFREAFGCDLRGAAGHHDRRAGTLALEAADRLARLPYRLFRHRTGIHNDGIGQTGTLRLTADHLALKGIESAAEGDDIDTHRFALALNRAGSNFPSYS